MKYTGEILLTLMCLVWALGAYGVITVRRDEAKGKLKFQIWDGDDD